MVMEKINQDISVSQDSSRKQLAHSNGVIQKLTFCEFCLSKTKHPITLMRKKSELLIEHTRLSVIHAERLSNFSSHHAPRTWIVINLLCFPVPAMFLPASSLLPLNAPAHPSPSGGSPTRPPKLGWTLPPFPKLPKPSWPVHGPLPQAPQDFTQASPALSPALPPPHQPPRRLATGSYHSMSVSGTK